MLLKKASGSEDGGVEHVVIRQYARRAAQQQVYFEQVDQQVGSCVGEIFF